MQAGALTARPRSRVLQLLVVAAQQTVRPIAAKNAIEKHGAIISSGVRPKCRSCSRAWAMVWVCLPDNPSEKEKSL